MLPDGLIWVFKFLCSVTWCWKARTLRNESNDSRSRSASLLISSPLVVSSFSFDCGAMIAQSRHVDRNLLFEQIQVYCGTVPFSSYYTFIRHANMVSPILLYLVLLICPCILHVKGIGCTSDTDCVGNDQNVTEWRCLQSKAPDAQECTLGKK